MSAETALVGRVLSIIIPGRLGSWQRAGRNAAQGQTYTPAQMRSDQAMVRQLAWVAMKSQGCTQLQGPLRLHVITQRHPPKSWSQKKQAAARWITARPDFDNTLKLIADALNKVAYDDDAQIADGRHIKRYEMAEPECVRIGLEELEPRP